MNVFISWSGIRSKKVAELLNKWIPDVIQAVSTWISSEDIEKGTIWFNEITETLKQTNVGIICLTPENKDNRWILFESGALLNKLTKAQVYTFLFDLTAEEVEKPLAEFNHTFPAEDDMFKLLKSINNQLEGNKLTSDRLKTAFDKNWSDFEKPFKKIQAFKLKKKNVVEPRTDDSMMKEMLSTVRSLEQRLSGNELTHNPYSPDFNPDTSPIKKAQNLAVELIKDNYPKDVIITTLIHEGFTKSSSNSIYLYADILADEEKEKNGYFVGKG